MTSCFTQAGNCNPNCSLAINGGCDIGRTTYAGRNCPGTIDVGLGVGVPTLGVVKDNITKNPVIEYRPKISDNRSHNNHYGSTDIKIRRP